MKFMITVGMSKGAFDDTFTGHSELPRILRQVALNIESHGQSPGFEYYLHDTNGRAVGKAKFTLIVDVDQF